MTGLCPIFPLCRLFPASSIHMSQCRIGNLGRQSSHVVQANDIRKHTKTDRIESNKQAGGGAGWESWEVGIVAFLESSAYLLDRAWKME